MEGNITGLGALLWIREILTTKNCKSKFVKICNENQFENTMEILQTLHKTFAILLKLHWETLQDDEVGSVEARKSRLNP